METRQYRVIRGHTSEYPNPISFTKGALLVVGERYEGPEGWDDWLFCDMPGQEGGWVPAQIVELIDGTTGRALEDYTARELDVQEGELLLSAKALNGWAWCENPRTLEAGWVPLANLSEGSQ
ncbi:MAG: SH3 domain-containing protein [Stenotrophomonas sp.]